MIEQHPVDRVKVKALLQPHVDVLVQSKADVIVLGCTHYPFVSDVLSQLVGPGVQIIETGLPVARQLQAKLHETGLHQCGPSRSMAVQSRVQFYTTGDAHEFKKRLTGLLGVAWRNAIVEHVDVV